MTAIELLRQDLDAEIKLGTKMVVNWDMYLEMEKQQIIDAAERWKGTDFAEKYYAETYGSKIGNSLEWNGEVTQGSNGNFKQFSLYEHKETIATANTPTSSQTEISDKSWEGCDGCTEQDEVMYKNGYVKGYNAAIAELPKEISDEEIEKVTRESAINYSSGRTYPEIRHISYANGFLEAIKWYREQLKKKQ